MAIRLNKVLTELNIGLQTAVEFLKNEKNLGEIKDDANMNTKITDEQYRALVQKFKGDKDVKSEAEKYSPKRPKTREPTRRSPRQRSCSSSVRCSSHWERLILTIWERRPQNHPIRKLQNLRNSLPTSR